MKLTSAQVERTLSQFEYSRGSSRGPAAQPFVRRAHVLSRNQRAQHRGANRDLTVGYRLGQGPQPGELAGAILPLNHATALPSIIAKRCLSRSDVFANGLPK